eukprot:scaffold46195_cov20-Tisochrysis_lutea.AAC.4
MEHGVSCGASSTMGPTGAAIPQLRSAEYHLRAGGPAYESAALQNCHEDAVDANLDPLKCFQSLLYPNANKQDQWG